MLYDINMTPKFPLFKIVLLIICFVTFLSVSFDQFDKFSSSETSTSTSLKLETKMRYPILVFCPKILSKSGDFNPTLPRDEYLNNTRPFWLSLGGVLEHPDDNNPYYLKVSSSSLFTFGHGVCKTIKFEEPIHSNYFVVFMTKVHVESIVFLLQDYYDQIFLSTMVVVHELPNFAISSSLGTSLSLKEVTYLNTLENPCKSESEVEESFGHCMVKALEKKALKIGFQCMPPQLIDFMPSYSGKDCKTEKEVRRSLHRAQMILHKMRIGQENHTCLASCKTYYYDVNAFPLNNIGIGLRYWDLAISFLTSMVQEEKEYLIYKPMDTVSSIGGALGMFLGWSLFQTLISICRFSRLMTMDKALK